MDSGGSSHSPGKAPESRLEPTSDLREVELLPVDDLTRLPEILIREVPRSIAEEGLPDGSGRGSPSGWDAAMNGSGFGDANARSTDDLQQHHHQYAGLKGPLASTIGLSPRKPANVVRLARADSDGFWSPKSARGSPRPQDGGPGGDPDQSRGLLDPDSELPDSPTGLKSGWLFKPLVQQIIRNVACILCWYFFSISLTFFNKLLFGKKQGHFPAPLLVTTVHFLLQSVIATILVKSKCGGLALTQTVSWQDYASKIVPTAIATALDIGLSNKSFVHLTVSFYEMVKSSAPVFLLLFAFLFRLESPSWKLLGIIVIICLGELLTVAGETNFELLGFIMVLMAAVMAGLRWTITQMLLQKEAFGMTHPMITLFYLAPALTVTMGLWSACTEPWHLIPAAYFDTAGHEVRLVLLLLLGAVLAFCMMMAEFQLISETSALTFSVAGVMKEVLTIMISVIIFKDKFVTVNLVGLILVIIGVTCFNIVKYQKYREGHGHGKGAVHGPKVDEPEQDEESAATTQHSRYELLPKGSQAAETPVGMHTGTPPGAERGDHFGSQTGKLRSKLSDGQSYSPKLTSRSPRSSLLVRAMEERHDDQSLS